MKHICRVSEVCFTFQDVGKVKHVLRNVNFSLAPGEVCGLLGESGVGKSTLLSILSGELRPLSGTVQFANEGSMRLGYFRQFDTLLPFRDLIENVGLLAERSQGNGLESGGCASKLLDEVGLSDRIHAYPEDLSGGMRQRVQIAQSLMVPATLLMLDEPFSQQDLLTQIRMEELISRVARFANSAVLIVSHDLGALAALCDRVMALGGHPASIHSSLVIDGELGSLGPANRRNSKDFSPLMTRLWDMRLAASQC